METKLPDDVEMLPDAWERFERVVTQSGGHEPMPKKVIPKVRSGKPSASDRKGPKDAS